MSNLCVEKDDQVVKRDSGAIYCTHCGRRRPLGALHRLGHSGHGPECKAAKTKLPAARSLSSQRWLSGGTALVVVGELWSGCLGGRSGDSAELRWGIPGTL